MYRRLYLLILFTLLPSFLLAAPYPQYGGTLRCSVYQKTNSFHPAQLSNYAEFLIASNIYEGLVRLDQNGQIIPALAECWERSLGGRIWLFHIDENAKFHNGNPVKSSDVKRSWKYLAQADNLLLSLSPLKSIEGYYEFRVGKTSKISGLQVINESILRLTLTKPVSDFLELLTLPQMWVFEDSNQPIGSGPFKLDKQKETESQLVVNENYRWGRPYLERLIFRYYENTVQARFDLVAGNLEIVLVSPFDAKEFHANELLEIPHKEKVCLWFNPQIFHKSEWKKAIMYAIDVDSTLKFQYSINHSSENKYDSEKAFRRLSSTGWNKSTEISLAYTSLSDNSGRAVAERIQRYLADVNISIKIMSFENNKGIPDLALLSIYQTDEEIQQNSKALYLLYELPVWVLRSPEVLGLNSYWGGIILFDKAWTK